MSEKKLRPQPFHNIGIDEFGFFVRQSESIYEAGNSIQENTFETWKQGKANGKICWTISVEKLAFKQFVRDYKTVYLYCECIAVPENSEYTIEQINDMLKVSKQKELSEFEKLQIEVEKQAKENAELRKQLEEKNIIKQTKKSKE